ncbi:hypothetical protein DFH27DRAFT_547835 [Peziza echinospora]|nr:hypothetical protein DFH27DRAFT_547835 [Peziza echinospora]
MKFTSFSSLFSLSLLALGVLSSPTPKRPHHAAAASGDLVDPFSKDQAGLSDSKRKPALLSKNRVITSDPNIVVRSATPNVSSPPSADARKALGLDSLRGFVGQTWDSETQQSQFVTTILVFNVPEEAKGKRCSFHFFFGSGDSNGEETFFLWSLDGRDNWFPEEFKTTWNNKPYRNQLTAEFESGKGPKITKEGTGEGRDAKFTLHHTEKVKHLEAVGEYKSFPCDPIVGKTAWEIVVKPKFNEKGQVTTPTSAWSMNKGLMIEVHGLQPLANDYA